jgi:putative YhbY family RNA-binding protein
MTSPTRPDPPELTPRERTALKGRAHALEPVVQVGQSGLTEAVIDEVDRALTAHELIKVKLGGADRDERAALIDLLCTRTGAAAVQSVGKVVVLWRPRQEDDVPSRHEGTKSRTPSR